ASDRSLAFDIQVMVRDLASNIAGATLTRVATVYDALRKEFRVSVPRVYPTAARGELILNLDRTRESEGTPAWTTTDRDIAFYIPWNGNEPTAGNRGRLFTIPSTGGPVFEEYSSNSGANSSNLTAQYEGPALSLGVHHARIVGTHVEYEPHGGTFSVEVVTDGVSQGPQTVNIGANLSRYGEATYGTSVYAGAGRLKAYLSQPITADGKSVVTKLVYTGTEQFKCFGYAHVIVPEPKPRTL
ncbi:MAG: hypothetical protein AB7P99_10140, partial [Vicinamibacterales bacterium]